MVLDQKKIYHHKDREHNTSTQLLYERFMVFLIQIAAKLILQL